MARHLIYRQKITLNLSGRQEAFALQEKVSRLIKNELADSLESALDRAFPPDKIARIDTLKLDLGAISLQNFENEFKAGFIEALAKSLLAKNEAFRHTTQSPDKKEELLSKPQSLKEALFFFLQKGYLPWYSPEWKINEWEAEILNNFSEEEYHSLIKWLRDKYPENPVVIDRLVFQFSDKFIEFLLVKIRPGFDGQWPLIFENYRFILSSLLKSPPVKKEQPGELLQDVGFAQNTFDASDIREKIWQFAFRVWLDTELNQPVTKILKMLLAYFGVRNRFGGGLKQSRIVEGVRTAVVKEALETVLMEGDEISAKKETAGNKQKNRNAQNDIGQSHLKESSPDPGNTGGEIKQAEDEQDAQAVAKAFLKRPPMKDNLSAANNNDAKPGDLITASNCGVVLLNPFFKKYFEDLGLTQNNAFVSETARSRAVLLLNYLVTGETQAAEYDLALQKILCGYPSDETLVTTIKPTKKEKAESESLLKAVISYWEPLHNTSIAGLRESFLRRAGNLELRESGWILKVEQKTLDILLGKLPWGFSTIRLPWMKDLLSVDWN